MAFACIAMNAIGSFPPCHGRRRRHACRMTTANPLLSSLNAKLPPFGDIQPEHALPALAKVLADNRAGIAALTAQQTPDWASLMLPLEAMDEQLGRVWGPVSHLNSVCDSEKLRAVYQQGVQQLTEYQAELAQNEALYAAIKRLRQGDAFAALDTERRAVVEHTLRDFRLGGAELQGADRDRFKTIQMRLSELATTFEQHLLDATRAYTLHLTDEADLAGIPDSIRGAAAQRAEAEDKEGWLFTLDAPSYVPFMQYAEARSLREKMYRAYTTRASEGDLDNTPVMDEILALRREAANLLGFANYGEYSLAPKMAASPDEVKDFLRELAAKSRPMAEQELAELRAFAAEDLGLPGLEAWDVAFASERLRRKTYAISQEELKPYFPEQAVLEGLFALVRRLYGLSTRENRDVPRWHKDVRYFELYDDEGQVAAFYLDPYARAHKRGGAWMDECISRWRRPDGELQLPVAYLTCNFDAPVGDKPALWTHDEVNTLFHEFGHGLHHMLTKTEALGGWLNTRGSHGGGAPACRGPGPGRGPGGRGGASEGTTGGGGGRSATSPPAITRAARSCRTNCSGACWRPRISSPA